MQLIKMIAFLTQSKFFLLILAPKGPVKIYIAVIIVVAIIDTIEIIAIVIHFNVRIMQY